MQTTSLPWRASACIATLLFTTSLFAQIGGTPVPAPPNLLQALDLQAGTMQELTLPRTAAEPLRVQILLDGRPHELQLTPYDVRAAGYQLLVDDGTAVRPVAAPAAVTLRGHVIGATDSIVAATLIEHQLRATVRIGDQGYGVQPASEVFPQLPVTTHVVYRIADLRKLPYQCGVAPGLGGGDPGPLGNSALKIAEIACDADYDYYLLNGSSTTNVQNDVTGVINAMDVIYKRDVTITYRITAIVVRTAPTYTSNDPGTLLNQFGSRWNSAHGSIKRDLAHLFTGKPRGSGVIGVAFLGVVCNVGSAYGLSWSRFTTNFTARVGLTAHEVGHNWNAPHCNSSNPCNIMCSGLGGCSGVLTSFAPVSINAIVAFKNSRGCLDNPNPPVISNLSQTTIKAWTYPPIQLTATGTDLDGVTRVTIGGVDAQSIIPVSPTQLRFVPPDLTPIGTQPVIAMNGAGSSPPVNMTVNGNHPSEIEVPIFAVRNFPTDYEVHSDKAWLAALFISTSNAPSTIPGVVSLGIGNNFNELLQIAALPCDARGYAKLTLTPPAHLPVGFKVYWQAVTYDPNNLQLPLEVSNVLPSTVL